MPIEPLLRGEYTSAVAQELLFLRLRVLYSRHSLVLSLRVVVSPTLCLFDVLVEITHGGELQRASAPVGMSPQVIELPQEGICALATGNTDVFLITDSAFDLGLSSPIAAICNKE